MRERDPGTISRVENESETPSDATLNKPVPRPIRMFVSDRLCPIGDQQLYRAAFVTLLHKGV